MMSYSVSKPNIANTRWSGEHVSRTFEFIACNKGLLLVAASQFFYSVVNLAVKQLNNIAPPVSTLEVIVFRMGMTLICCVLYMVIAKIPDPLLGPKGVRALLFTRGVAGFVYLFGAYYSLRYLSLSDATVLTFLCPLLTAIAGAVFLHELFTWQQALSGIFSLIGVILIARPTFIFRGSTGADRGGPETERGTPTERLIAVGVALLGVLGLAVSYITLRAIGKRAHPLHSLVAFSILCVIMGCVGMFIEGTPVILPARLDALLLLCAIGLFGLVAQIFLVMGLQLETAGRGVLTLYLQIIFAIILERVFLNYTPSILSILGIVIILTSAIYIALTKPKSDVPDDVVPSYLASERSRTREDLEAAMDRALLEGVDRNKSYSHL